MPTIAVDKAALFKALGQQYTTEEFDELCFEFGLELDEDTSNHERPIVDGKQEPAQLKIEVPANRYDMLCIEGISMMLNVFREKRKLPNYRTITPPSGRQETIVCHESTARIRPFVSGAILRNVKFTQERYESFIALQDKLHQNIARQRTLVAIGTHDLDTIKPPFSYEALPPQEMKFVPLNQKKSMNGHELMEYYKTDKHLSRYLHIIRDSPVYPYILDANRTVCSMPPIINSEHTKIKPTTRNVFIDITATDRTKLEIVNHILVCMFSEYCSEPFTVEPVQIVSKHNNESRTVPNLTPRKTTASLSYINACCGLDLSAAEVSKLLTRMAYTASPSTSNKDTLDISVPPTRADVLHQADIMEDVAIAYGFNRLPRAFPSISGTVAQPLPINKLADIIRLEAAMAGWTEVLPLILCSHDENFAHLKQRPSARTGMPVKLANPKTAEYQIVRTTLIPGLLKTLRENKGHALPLRIFEVSDVAFQDLTLERKSRNQRHFAAAYIGKTGSGFEVVHGLLDRVLLMLKAAFVTRQEGLGSDSAAKSSGGSYWIEAIADHEGGEADGEGEGGMFFAGHGAAIFYKPADAKQAKRIGQFGILHPEVLDKFELRYPVSVLEMDVEVFL